MKTNDKKTNSNNFFMNWSSVAALMTLVFFAFSTTRMVAQDISLTEDLQLINGPTKLPTSNKTKSILSQEEITIILCVNQVITIKSGSKEKLTIPNDLKENEKTKEEIAKFVLESNSITITAKDQTKKTPIVLTRTENRNGAKITKNITITVKVIDCMKEEIIIICEEDVKDFYVDNWQDFNIKKQNGSDNKPSIVKLSLPNRLRINAKGKNASDTKTVIKYKTIHKNINEDFESVDVEIEHTLKIQIVECDKKGKIKVGSLPPNPPKEEMLATVGSKDQSAIRSFFDDSQNSTNISVTEANTPPQIISATGTGQTTGDVANVTMQNTSSEVITYTIGPVFIPSDGKYQSYLIPHGTVVELQPGEIKVITLKGYCLIINRSSVPEGYGFPPFEDWQTVSIDPEMANGSWTASSENGWTTASFDNSLVTSTIPGTNVPLNHTINQEEYPEEFAQYGYYVYTVIEETYDSLYATGEITTPFSSDPEKEKETVIQQTLWMTTIGPLTGGDYKIQQFEENVIEQYETATKTVFENQPSEAQDDIRSGVVTFWNTFQGIGEGSKIINAKSDFTLCTKDESSEKNKGKTSPKEICAQTI